MTAIAQTGAEPDPLPEEPAGADPLPGAVGLGDQGVEADEDADPRHDRQEEHGVAKARRPELERADAPQDGGVDEAQELIAEVHRGQRTGELEQRRQLARGGRVLFGSVQGGR